MMSDLTQSRRAVALRIAEAIDAKWPNLNREGFDVDEATDVIEALIPVTAAEAEAEAEMELMRDDDDDDDEVSPLLETVAKVAMVNVENPALKAFKDAVGCGPVSIMEATKAATEKLTPRWYQWHEVSREIWDGDIWWWDNGETIVPVSIMWSPTTQNFFATLGQWGWGRAQDLSEMEGRWMPCVEPEPDEAFRESVREYFQE